MTDFVDPNRADDVVLAFTQAQRLPILVDFAQRAVDRAAGVDKAVVEAVLRHCREPKSTRNDYELEKALQVLPPLMKELNPSFGGSRADWVAFHTYSCVWRVGRCALHEGTIYYDNVRDAVDDARLSSMPDANSRYPWYHAENKWQVEHIVRTYGWPAGLYRWS